MVSHWSTYFGSRFSIVLTASFSVFASFGLTNMNFLSNKNAHFLKDRLGCELPLRDLYLPLCHPSEVRSKYIWEIVNIAPEDFEGIVTVFKNWGISNSVVANAKVEFKGVKVVGSDKRECKQKWVNFKCDCSMSITMCAEGAPRLS